MQKNLSIILILLIIGCSKNSNNEIIEIKTEIPTFELDYMVKKWSESFVEKIDSTNEETNNFKSFFL